MLIVVWKGIDCQDGIESLCRSPLTGFLDNDWGSGNQMHGQNHGGDSAPSGCSNGFIVEQPAMNLLHYVNTREAESGPPARHRQCRPFSQKPLDNQIHRGLQTVIEFR